MITARKLASIRRDERAVLTPLRVPLRRVMDDLKRHIIQSLRNGFCEDFRNLFTEEMLEILNAGTEIAFLKGGRRAELSAEKVIEESEKENAPVTFSLNDRGAAKIRGVSQYLRRVSGLDPSDSNRIFHQQNRQLLQNLSDEAYSIVRKKLNDLILRGVHIRGGAKELNEVLEQAGLNTLAESQITTIFRTQSVQAYNAGRWSVVHDDSIGESIWGFEYRTAYDARVRDEHRLLEGVRLPKEDPFWKKFFPPNGWNCRCTAIEIWNSEPEAKIDYGITGKDPRKRDPSIFNVPAEFQNNPGMVVEEAPETTFPKNSGKQPQNIYKRAPDLGEFPPDENKTEATKIPRSEYSVATKNSYQDNWKPVTDEQFLNLGESRKQEEIKKLERHVSSLFYNEKTKQGIPVCLKGLDYRLVRRYNDAMEIALDEFPFLKSYLLGIEPDSETKGIACFSQDKKTIGFSTNYDLKKTLEECQRCYKSRIWASQDLRASAFHEIGHGIYDYIFSFETKYPNIIGKFNSWLHKFCEKRDKDYLQGKWNQIVCAYEVKDPNETCAESIAYVMCQKFRNPSLPKDRANKAARTVFEKISQTLEEIRKMEIK